VRCPVSRLLWNSQCSLSLNVDSSFTSLNHKDMNGVTYSDRAKVFPGYGHCTVAYQHHLLSPPWINSRWRLVRLISSKGVFANKIISVTSTKESSRFLLAHPLVTAQPQMSPHLPECLRETRF
jgi:hypothetical protein